MWPQDTARGGTYRSTRVSQLSQGPPFHNVVWAVDISPDDPEWLAELTRTANVIETFLPNTEVYPIHILSPDGLAWQSESPQERSKRLSPVASAALEWVQDYAIGGAHLNRPIIGECQKKQIFKSNRRTTARKLSRWADRLHADIIVAGYHPTPTFLKPFQMNFAEHILAESKESLLMIGPKCIATRMDSVIELVFPTNFSEECLKTFADAVTWARYLDADLKLFYKHEPRPGPAVASGTLLLGGMSEIAPINMESEVHSQIINDWVEQGAQKGVTVEFVRDETAQGTSEAILHFLTSCHNPLLIMSACQGPLESGLWGSVTRDVVSQSFAPVLVLRA